MVDSRQQRKTRFVSVLACLRFFVVVRADEMPFQRLTCVVIATARQNYRSMNCFFIDGPRIGPSPGAISLHMCGGFPFQPALIRLRSNNPFEKDWGRVLSWHKPNSTSVTLLASVHVRQSRHRTSPLPFKGGRTRPSHSLHTDRPFCLLASLMPVLQLFPL